MARATIVALAVLALIVGASASSKTQPGPMPSFASVVVFGDEAGGVPVESSLGIWGTAAFTWVTKYFRFCERPSSRRACTEGQVICLAFSKRRRERARDAADHVSSRRTTPQARRLIGDVPN